MIQRRDFITLLGGAAAAWPLAACAQQENPRAKALLFRILQLEADNAASFIGQFVNEMISQIGWTTQLPWSVGTMDQRRFDAMRLLRQVPAITEFMMLDADGKEKLRVSRLSTDVVEAGTDLSQDARFTEAVAHKVYFSPAYLAHITDIFMSISVAGTRRESGVTAAEVALKQVYDVIRQLKVGEHGAAYVLDRQDRIIAHSAMFTPAVDAQDRVTDAYFGLFQRDLSGLAQVRAARQPDGTPTDVVRVHDFDGREVLATWAKVPLCCGRPSSSWSPLDWLVVVELPVAEADT